MTSDLQLDDLYRHYRAPEHADLAPADHGLVTEHLEGVTFPQRRFADDAERFSRWGS